jgi:hypothetical protein
VYIYRSRPAVRRCVIVADSNFIDSRLGHDALSSTHGRPSPALGPAARGGGVVVLGGGEASGPLYPPAVIDESMFSCEPTTHTTCTPSPRRLCTPLRWWRVCVHCALCVLQVRDGRRRCLLVSLEGLQPNVCPHRD